MVCAPSPQQFRVPWVPPRSPGCACRPRACTRPRVRARAPLRVRPAPHLFAARPRGRPGGPPMPAVRPVLTAAPEPSAALGPV
jgi:hypothetical protein